MSSLRIYHIIFPRKALFTIATFKCLSPRVWSLVYYHFTLVCKTFFHNGHTDMVFLPPPCVFAYVFQNFFVLLKTLFTMIALIRPLSLCILWRIFRLALSVKHFTQLLHLYGFSPVCVLCCTTIVLSWAKHLPQLLLPGVNSLVF